MLSKTLFGLLIVLLSDNILAIKIITKSQWGGAPATNKTSLSNGLSYAVIHHTAFAYCSTKVSCKQQMKNIQSYHQKTLGWTDIGYNFLIGGDGNVYEGRGWNVMGAHAANWNSKSIGISFMGNYNNDKPNAAQVSAAKSLLTTAVSRAQIKSDYVLYGHRQVGSTECPGNNLFIKIKKWSNWKA
ncbi:peptidoglycan-recognition protein SC2-like [Calliphora vicina]|uniref:peptidoglycan-recognition protein SC2-like n=1 Tax=Calliphora vicina TaxID=7373 RepID=UPI00325B040F